MLIEILQAAQQVGEQAITTAQQHGDIAEKTVSQFPLAYGIVKLIEVMKKSKVPGLRWISEQSSPRFLAFINAAAAFLATIGITGTFQYADTGALTIVITGLADVGSKFFSFGSQWAFQQFFYENIQTRNVTVVTHNVVMGTGSGQISDESTNPTGKAPGAGDGKAA